MPGCIPLSIAFTNKDVFAALQVPGRSICHFFHRNPALIHRNALILPGFSTEIQGLSPCIGTFYRFSPQVFAHLCAVYPRRECIYPQILEGYPQGFAENAICSTFPQESCPFPQKNNTYPQFFLCLSTISDNCA